MQGTSGSSGTTHTTGTADTGRAVPREARLPREAPAPRDLLHLDRVAERLALDLVAQVDGVDAVALTLEAPGTPLGCRVATAPLARELCRIQRSTGEGPSVDVLRSGLAVYVDRSRFGRWPTFAVAADAHGVRVQAAVPVLAGPSARGVLSAYGLHRDDLDARARRRVHDLGRVLGTWTAEITRHHGQDGVAGGTTGGMRPEDRRRLVDRAVGILQERYATSAARAARLLDDSAARQHVDLEVVARHVVDQAERWAGDQVPRPREG